jgi:hypothetical protein
MLSVDFIRRLKLKKLRFIKIKLLTVKLIDSTEISKKLWILVCNEPLQSGNV